MKNVSDIFGRYFIIAGYLPAVALLTVIRVLVVPVLPLAWQKSLEQLAGAGIGQELAVYVIGPLFLGVLLMSLDDQIVRLYRADFLLLALRGSQGEHNVNHAASVIERYRRRIALRLSQAHIRHVAQLKPFTDELEAQKHKAVELPIKREEIKANIGAALDAVARLTDGVELLSPEHLAWTRLGNIYLWMDEYPRTRYGMGLGTMWPRLRSVLPKDFGEQLKSQNAVYIFLLNNSALAIVFAALWLGVGALALFGHIQVGITEWIVVFLASLAGAWLLYRWATDEALQLARLVACAFDLYRGELLRQYRVQPAASAQAESTLWQQLEFFINVGDPVFHPALIDLKSQSGAQQGDKAPKSA